VCEDVAHELAFGLESIGMDTVEIREKIANTAEYFGITRLIKRKTATLSGGEKQLVALAAVLITKPRLLLLDEPLSSLDMRETQRFLTVLKKLNSEQGITVIISAHNFETVLPMCSRVIMLDKGAIAFDGSKEEFSARLEKRITAKSERFSKENSAFESAAELKNVSFSYGEKQILNNVSLSVRKGEIFALLGDNGAGKSTLLDVLCGIKEKNGGDITVPSDTVFYMPQDVRYLFTKDSVIDELSSIKKECGGILHELDLFRLISKNPYDLSGGEQQRLALSMCFASDKKLLLLDEPTKGMDYESKEKLCRYLKGYTKNGGTVLLVTHDMCFAYKSADRCARLVEGEISEALETDEFFNKNHLNTWDYYIEIAETEGTVSEMTAATAEKQAEKSKKVSVFSLLLCFSAVAALTICFAFVKERGAFYGVISAIVLLCGASIYEFERSNPGAGGITLLSVLCALAVAGRAAFFAVPNFKPTLAIVIIAGAALGSNAGFIVGNIAMLVSNFIFGQGTWTVFQMFAAGAVGFIAGFIGDRTEKRGYRVLLSLFGAVSAIVIYGGIVNPSYIITYQSEITLPMIIAVYASGITMDITHGIGTGLFLWFGAVPMLKRLKRVKIKYGQI